MTLQEAKDRIAKGYGHGYWHTFREDGMDWRVYEEAHDEAAELYAKSARDLVKEQRGQLEYCHKKMAECYSENAELQKKYDALTTYVNERKPNADKLNIMLDPVRKNP